MFAYSHTCFSSLNEQILSLGFFFSVVLFGSFGFLVLGFFFVSDNIQGKSRTRPEFSIRCKTCF